MSLTRLTKLREAMSTGRWPIDGLLVSAPSNRFYLSGFTGSAGVLLITASKAWLLTDFRYMSQAPEQSPDFEVVQHAPHLLDTVKTLCMDHQIRQLGFEQDAVMYGYFLELERALANTRIDLIACKGIVEELRMTKDESELQIMREAAAIADNTFAYILGQIKPGMREREVAWLMEQHMRELGASGPSFETIVASGERSALPHGIASDRIIGSGELVKLDFGAKYKGYCSDLTRTVALGVVPDELKRIYAIVLEAQQRALDGIKAGMTGKEADAIARTHIANAGYGDRFGHGTGHGLGIDIHEAPTLSPRGEHALVPGMIVTIEPGIYLPGLGGVRIEDDVIVTVDGVHRLTHADKSWTQLDA
jgi:Xaa-Pro aminopeptidase